MDITDINMAIGEAIGWEKLEREDPSSSVVFGKSPESEDSALCLLPDFVRNLMSMRSALGYLDDDEWMEFMLYLTDELRLPVESGKWYTARAFLEAPTEAMARSFVKAKGL